MEKKPIAGQTAPIARAPHVKASPVEKDEEVHVEIKKLNATTNKTKKQFRQIFHKETGKITRAIPGIFFIL